MHHRTMAPNSEVILACFICALAFIGVELVNAPFGWEDELGFHFGAP